MPSEVSVTDEVLIPLPLAELWVLVTQPEAQERFESRVRLVSKTEGAIELGSGFVLQTRGTLLTYEVVEVVPPTRIAWQVTVEGSVGTQYGDLVSHSATATLLRWTVSQPVRRPMGWLVERMCRRELRNWLAAVQRVATP